VGGSRSLRSSAPAPWRLEAELDANAVKVDRRKRPGGDEPFAPPSPRAGAPDRSHASPCGTPGDGAGHGNT
jgi:hypothetical protein